VNSVFFGTSSFALPTLEILAQRFGLRAVFTRPDAIARRGQTPDASPVKTRAHSLGIPVYTPHSLCTRSQENAKPLNDTLGQRIPDAHVVAHIQQYKPDVIVVASYGLILPPALLGLAQAGCVNVHASLLPRWRGAAPIQRAILAGDREVGVSIMRVEAGLDSGPYCGQAAVAAQDKTYEQLVDALGKLGARLLSKTLPAIVEGSIAWTAQDTNLATYAHKLRKGSIDLDDSLTQIENINRVRASSTHIRCRAVLFGQPVVILAARLAQPTESRQLLWQCADGPIAILELKPDGRQAMSGQAFLAGYGNREHR
jgi:methionyl-tRNA formyltransferase